MAHIVWLEWHRPSELVHSTNVGLMQLLQARGHTISGVRVPGLATRPEELLAEADAFILTSWGVLDDPGGNEYRQALLDRIVIDGARLLAVTSTTGSALILDRFGIRGTSMYMAQLERWDLPGAFRGPWASIVGAVPATAAIGRDTLFRAQSAVAIYAPGLLRTFPPARPLLIAPTAELIERTDDLVAMPGGHEPSTDERVCGASWAVEEGQTPRVLAISEGWFDDVVFEFNVGFIGAVVDWLAGATFLSEMVDRASRLAAEVETTFWELALTRLKRRDGEERWIDHLLPNVRADVIARAENAKSPAPPEVFLTLGQKRSVLDHEWDLLADIFDADVALRRRERLRARERVKDDFVFVTSVRNRGAHPDRLLHEPITDSELQRLASIHASMEKAWQRELLRAGPDFAGAWPRDGVSPGAA